MSNMNVFYNDSGVGVTLTFRKKGVSRFSTLYQQKSGTFVVNFFDTTDQGHVLKLLGPIRTTKFVKAVALAQEWVYNEQHD